MKGGGHGHVCSPDDLSATNWQTTHGSIVFPCAHVLDELCSRVGRKEPKKSCDGEVAVHVTMFKTWRIKMRIVLIHKADGVLCIRTIPD